MISSDSSCTTGWSYLRYQSNTGDAQVVAPVARNTKPLSCFSRSLWSLENTPTCPGLSNRFSEIGEPVRRSVSLPDLTICPCENNEPSKCGKKRMPALLSQGEAKQWGRESELNSDGGHAAECLLTAIENNDSEVVQSLIHEPLLDFNMEVISKTSRRWCTPLMLAIERNFLELARIILKVETVEINRVLGSNALHVAAQEGNADAVDLLVRSGADVNARDVNGWTSLMKACKTKNEDIVRLLLDYQADVTLVNLFELSALNILVNDDGAERPDLLVLLIEHGAPVDQCDMNAWFPLIIAIKNGCLQYIRVLLGEGWEKATCQNEGLVFLFAAVYGNESVLRYLYDKMPKNFLSFKDVDKYCSLRGIDVSHYKTVLTLLKERYGDLLSPELPETFFSLKSQCRRVIQRQMLDRGFDQLPLSANLKNYCAQTQLPILVDNEEELRAFYRSEYETEDREDWFLTWGSPSPVDSVDWFHEESWGI